MLDLVRQGSLGCCPWLVPGGGLIVADIEDACKDLVARGINASEVFHGSPFSLAGRISGPDPERQSYRSYASFEDPDGNVWIVQEVTRRLPGRVDPATTDFASASDLAKRDAARGSRPRRAREAQRAAQPELARTRTQRTSRQSRRGPSCGYERHLLVSSKEKETSTKGKNDH